MIYLVLFAAWLMLTSAYQNDRRAYVLGSRRMELRWLYIGILVFSMCLLAGLRAPGVGTDTYSYAIPVFNKVRRYTSYGELVKNARLETGYETLAYLCSRALDDIHLLYFMTELLICVPVCFFATHWPRERQGSLMLMAAWLFIYHNGTYNMMRQWIAMGLGLCACMFLIDKRPIRAASFFLVSLLFHYSAIVIAIQFGIIVYLERGDRSLFRTFLLLAVAAVGMVSMGTIAQALIARGIVNERYSHYITSIQEASSTHMQLMSKLPVIAGFTVLYRELYRHDQRNRIIYAFLLLDALICGMVERVGFAALRLGVYFGVWQCVAIAQLYQVISGKVRRRYRWAVAAVFFAILLVYWSYYYVYRGFDWTIPYRTDVF